MGLFSSAFARAGQTGTAVDQVAATPAAATAEAATPAAAWEQAERVDLAGFPLPAPATGSPACAPLGRVAATPAGIGSSLDIPFFSSGVGKEQYRILRTRVLEAMAVRQFRSLLITSAIAGEGKTLVAANFALQCGSLRQGRVLLMDADLRRAGLSHHLRPASELGLSDYLRGDAPWEPMVREFDPWLSVLPTRCTQDDAAELLASQRMMDLLEAVQDQYDLVLLDGAPVTPVADSRILARLTRASLLVVRAGTTPTTALEQAAALLNPTLLGSVLNASSEVSHRKYAYTYSYPPQVPEVLR
ncbi:MAG: CpsD/CapB family tyrosine-protein kinase [Terriglobales bacterium]